MTWSDEVDAILGGDQVVAFAYVTPAKGVVVLPLTNTGVRDRAAGIVEPVSSSVGMWRKLERIQRNPRVAVAYHSRHLSYTDRPEYVLVQGRATLTPVEERDWVERHREQLEPFYGPLGGPLTRRWMSAFEWRSAARIEVERIVVWPDLECRGTPAVHGAPLPEPPAPQRPPRNGTGPRVDHRRAARRASRLSHRLAGWVGGDGYPVIVPVAVGAPEETGIRLAPPAGTLPPGGRRAGLLAHSFDRYTWGQAHRNHTGWLEADGDEAVYAPHTDSGFRLPNSVVTFRIAAGVGTRWGVHQARRAGFLGA